MKHVNNMTRILFLAGTVFMLNCKGEIRHEIIDETDDYITIIIKPENKVKQKRMSELFEIIQYVPLETNEDIYVGNIRKLVHADERFYIFDDITQRIYCFYEDGSYFFKIDKTGGGPGEYIEITDFSYNQGKLYILDVRSGRVLIYNDNGEFLHDKSRKIYSSEFEVFQDELALYHSNFTPNEHYKKGDTYFNILIASNIVDCNEFYLPFHENINKGKFITNSRNISRNLEEVLLWQKFDDYLYKFNNEGFGRAYNIEFKNDNRSHSRRIIAAIKEENLSFDKTENLITRLGYCTILDVIESSEILYLVYKQGNYFHYIYYDRDTGRLIELSNAYEDGVPPYPIINDIDGVSYYPLMSARDDVFYSYAQPYDLITNKIAEQDTHAIIGDLGEYDNPVIVMLKIKIEESPIK